MSPSEKRPTKDLSPAPRRHPLAARAAVCLALIATLCMGLWGGYALRFTHTDQVQDELQKNWAYPNREKPDMQKAALEGMISALDDPYTHLFTPSEGEAYNQSVDGAVLGIGLGYRPLERGVLVIEAYQDGPAEKAGILPGDIITQVNGTDITEEDAPVGELLTDGGAGTRTLTVQRGQELLTVEVEVKELQNDLFYEVRTAGDKSFGYVQLTTFGSDTGEHLEEALQDFKEQHIDTLVLDLRDNGGGYLTAAKQVLDLFVKKGELLFTVDPGSGIDQKHRATGRDKFTFAHSYLLINGETASASEIAAAALSQLADFQLVGTQTYGKGVVQRQKELTDGSILKYTYARWLTPDGSCVEGQGLTPDIEVANPQMGEDIPLRIERDWQVDGVGDEVAYIQQLLATLGYAPDRTDGYYSEATRQAMQDFERQHGLEPDGICSHSDYRYLVAYTVLHISSDENDDQYRALLEQIEQL